MAHPHQREYTNGLLSKHGLVVTELARTLLACLPGERIGRVQEYAEQFDAGVGTVQAALEALGIMGAARLEPRGRLGTYATQLNYPLLWSLAFNRPLVGAMPLPFSHRFAGLATGIRSQFAQQPVGLDLRFLRGAHRRMEALAAQACDWAIVSRYAAEHAEQHGFRIERIADLGIGSYMARHVLLIGGARATGIEDGMRVGVDRQSADHIHLVQTLCRNLPVEQVEIEYSQGLYLISTRQIDATVWSQDDLPPELPHMTVVPLEHESLIELGALSEATLIVNRANRAAAHVLGAVLNYVELQHIQAEVVQRKRLPAY